MSEGLRQYLRRLPHNVEAEMALLGAVLIDNRVLLDVRDRLTTGDFVLDRHQTIWAQICGLSAAGQLADPLTLKCWAEAEPLLEEHGGGKYLVRLADCAVPRITARSYADMLADCAERREAIAAADNLRDAAYSGNGTLAAAKALALDELGATRSPGRGTLVRAADLQGKPVPQRNWLVEDWLPVGHVTSLYGDGGVGKSLLGQQLITCAAGALPWLGLQTVRCPAMGLFAEDDIEELHARQQAINNDLGIDFRDLPDLHLWSLLGEEATLMEIDDSGRGHLTPLWHEVRRRVLRLGVRLLVVDTAAATFGGNELIRGQVTQFTRIALGRLASEMNGVVLMCAHPSRAGLASGEGDGGSTAWNAGVRSRLYFARAEGDDGGTADDARRVLARKKANYASIGDEIELTWRDGVFVRTDQPAGGIIEAIEKRNAATAFLDALDQAIAAGRNVSDSANAANYAPRVLVQMSASRGFKVRDFERAMNRLFGEGAIRVNHYGPPSKGMRRIEPIRKHPDPSTKDRDISDGQINQ